MRIACLHTVDANIAVFEAAAAGAGVELSHRVRADLLKSAEAAGRSTAEIDRQTADVLLDLAPRADAVLLTCSTIGRGAELAAAEARVPVIRVDEALAREVARRGGRALVLCAAETTMEPTRRLFERHAADAAVSLEFALVPGAWGLYRAGDVKDYAERIAEAADAAFEQGFDTVALAQASMSAASALCKRGKPLTSPAAGLAQVLSAVTNS